MKIKILLSLLIISFFSCKKQSSTVENDLKKAISKDSLGIEINNTQPNLEEEIIDSLNVGQRGRFKLDFKKYRGDSTWVVLKFYEKKDSKWILKNDTVFEKDGIIGCDEEFKDFNNDGYNDFTFKSSVGARGANEIRTLLIFDSKKGKLRHMKNSERFPNLSYNKKLDCIDAQAFYGGSTTYFLKIEKDSLREFASISSFDNQIEINLIDKKGNQKLLKALPIGNEDAYTRYSNFQPLEILREN